MKSDLDIFAQAIEIVDPNKRQKFIMAACGGDRQLRDRVVQLLESYRQAESLLEQPLVATDFVKNFEPPVAQQLERRSDTTQLAHASELLSDNNEVTERQIGPYRLLEKIGEGGFGEVFVAEQTEPVQRKVAIKIIKPGMDSREVIARFSAERQALAIMDHPNIARVFDGGTTSRGLPYFVMELVRGMCIVKYCDTAKLPIQKRLSLFIDTCRAIQHAHQKGIIHRDIKPSNVLVTLHDGEPVVKVIDFGVAKALNQRLTNMTVYTRFSFMIGTPAYMSPEQAELSGLDIDTRSDIYSLGVLLYELVTGSPPFLPTRFAKATMDEMRRIIRDEEPPRPSMRISSMGPTASSISQLRSVEPARLQSILRGDLDWIAMKALAKDRGQRYETANGLAADVKRFLDGDTVTARPPSWSYVTSRFVRRNKRLVVSAAFVLAAVLVGAIISISLAIWAFREQKRAHAQERLAVRNSIEANEERDRAERAETAAIENLLLSRMAFTDLNLKSRRQGQQWESLKAIHESIALAERTGTLANHQITLRSQVISALTRVDVKPVRSISAPNEANRFFSFTADFSKVAWWIRDGDINYITIRHVEDPDKELIRVKYPFDTRTSFHDEVVNRLSPDGRFLTMGSGQHGTILWDLTRNQMVRDMQAYYIVGGQSFSADSKWLAVVERTPAGADDNVNIYHLPSGELHRTLTLPKARQVAFSSDSRQIIVAGTDQLWICEVESGTKTAEVRQTFGGWGPAIAWSPSGELIAVSNANQVEMWYVSDLVKGHPASSSPAPKTVPTPFCTLIGHEALVDRLMFHPLHEHLLISSSWDNTTRFWNVFSGFEQLMVPQSRPSISADGRRIALTTATSAEICDFLPGDACRWIWRGNAEQLVFEPQNAWLAIGTNRGTKFWSIPSLAPIGSIGENESYGLAWDESKSGLLVGNSLGLFEIPVNGNQESLLQMGPSRQILTTSVSNFCQVNSSGNGRWVSAGEMEDWSPLVLDRNSGDVTRLHRASRSQAISISPNGQWLAQHAGDGIYIRELATGQDLDNEMTRMPSTGLTFSPDSQWLLLSSNQGTRFVNFSNPILERQVEQTIRMFSVPFANCQKLVVLPKGPGALKVLHREDQEVICELQYPDPPRLFAYAKFSPDDSLLAVTHETSAAVWDIQMIRDQLVELGLDWERSTTSGPVANSTVKRVEIIPGDLEVLQSFFEKVDSLSRHDVAEVADRLIQSGNTLPDVYYFRGWSRESLGDYTSAVDDMSWALNQAPYCESWRKDLANCLLESFRFEEACEVYWRIADPRKSHSAQLAFQQLCYICASRPESIPNPEEFRKLLDLWLAALDGQDTSSHFGLLVSGLSAVGKQTLWEAVGMALHGLKDNDRALSILKQHARTERHGGNSVLAVLYAGLGDLAKAENCLEIAESFPRKFTSFSYGRMQLLFYDPLLKTARRKIRELRETIGEVRSDPAGSKGDLDSGLSQNGRFDSVDLAAAASVNFGRIFVLPANDKPEFVAKVEGNLCWWQLTQADRELRLELPVPGPGQYELTAKLVGSHYCGKFEVTGQCDELSKAVDLYMTRKSANDPVLTLVEDFQLGSFEAVSSFANGEVRPAGQNVPDEETWSVSVIFRAAGKHEKSVQFSLLIDEIIWSKVAD